MIKCIISFNLVISFIVSFNIMKRKKERKGISVYVVVHTENPIYASNLASKVVNAYIIVYVLYI